MPHPRPSTVGGGLCAAPAGMAGTKSVQGALRVVTTFAAR